MTMSSFSSDVLARMQATQESAMQDECQLWSYTEGSLDDYGRSSSDPYSLLTTTPCGYKPDNKGEAMGKGQVVLTAGELRLPVSIEDSLTQTARIKLTKRFGVALTTPLTFNIVGNPERGPSGLVLKLERVTDGTTPS